MIQLPLSQLLVASVIAGMIGITSLFIVDTATPGTYMRFDANDTTLEEGELFSVSIVVGSVEPVNVFKGLVTFDPTVLRVKTISYNTSIANLWAERPWYSNGDGTLNFIGGTTKLGGFTGQADLLTIEFEAINTGTTKLSLADIRILKHDGLGSDATIQEPIDTIFTVNPEQMELDTVVADSTKESQVYVLSTEQSTDLNGDGKQTIADTSIFMQHLLTNNLRSDFNQDGRVTLQDLSILMDQ